MLYFYFNIQLFDNALVVVVLVHVTLVIVARFTLFFIRTTKIGP